MLRGHFRSHLGYLCLILIFFESSIGLFAQYAETDGTEYLQILDSRKYTNILPLSDYSTVLASSDRLFFLTQTGSTVYWLKNGRLDSLDIGVAIRKNRLLRYTEVRGIQVDTSGHVHIVSFHGYGRYYYQEFNAEGEVLNQTKIKNLKLDKDSYTQIVNGYFNRGIQFHNEHFVLPLRQKEGGWSPDSAGVCTWLHNQKDQLFGVFDKKESCFMYLGDSILYIKRFLALPMPKVT